MFSYNFYYIVCSTVYVIVMQKKKPFNGSAVPWYVHVKYRNMEIAFADSVGHLESKVVGKKKQLERYCTVSRTKQCVLFK